MILATQSILILDDDEIVRKSLVYYFEDTEWLPLEAQSGDEALAIIADAKPDAAIIDQRLPGMDGDAFIRQAIQINSDIAYVIFSGSIEYELPPDLVDQACVSNRVFVKPLADLEPLEQEIVTVLQQIRGEFPADTVTGQG